VSKSCICPNNVKNAKASKINFKKNNIFVWQCHEVELVLAICKNKSGSKIELKKSGNMYYYVI
jgi:hypothetical protein